MMDRDIGTEAPPGNCSMLLVLWDEGHAWSPHYVVEAFRVCLGVLSPSGQASQVFFVSFRSHLAFL
jgi:hypothetical protein